MENGVMPVMDVGGSGNSVLNGEGLWLFAILALFGFGGNGLFGGGQNGRCATVEDLNNSANFTRLENQVMNNGNRIEQKTDAIYGGMSSLGYEIARQFNQTQAQMSQCCCETQRAIDGVRYEGLQNTQKVLDAIAQNKIEALQQKIQALELKDALSNVVRYPNTFTYNAGASPFCASPTSCGFAM